MTTPTSDLTLPELQDLRRRIVAGEKIPHETLAAALRALRAHRSSALKGTRTAKSKALASKSVDDLLSKSVDDLLA